MPRCRPSILLVLVLSLGPAPGPASAAPPSQSVTPGDVVLVPGTAAGLARALGIESPMPRSRIVREAIRIVFIGPDDEKANPKLGRLKQYLGVVGEYEAQLAAATADGTISLALARQKPARDRLESLLDATGFRLREKDGAYRVEKRDGDDNAARRTILAEAGLDLDALGRDLNAGRTFTARLPADEVPLPFTPAAWSTALEKNVTPRTLLPTILTDRKAAYIYYGATALDEATQTFLVANPELLGRLYRDNAAEFATTSCGLRVRGTRVLVPGGERAEALWQLLVGERPDDAVNFVRRVFSRDEGRLAYFYDTVSRLDPSRQAFALGFAAPNAGVRQERFRALYDTTGTAITGWKPSLHPFLRNFGDFGDVLARVKALPDGRLATPAWSNLWKAVFDDADLPADPTRTLNGAVDRPMLDAADLVDLLSVGTVSQRRDRLATFLFAQQAFRNAAAADAPNLLVALRGFVRYRALAPTLRRMGIDDPALHARAARVAAALRGIADEDRSTRATCEFQGALSLVERARFARAIDAATARRLASSLIALPRSEDGEYAGQIARWCEGELLPALAPATGQAVSAASAEAIVLGAFAPRTSAVRTAPTSVTWEEQSYQVNLVAPELDRMDKVRAKLQGNSLNAVLAFARVAATLATSVTTLDALKRETDELDRAGRELRQPYRLGWQTSDRLPDPREVVNKALKNLRKIGKAKDLKKLPQIADPLVRMADVCLAETLPTLAYVPSLGDPDDSVLLGGNVVVRHEFGAHDDSLTPEGRLRAPWAIPQQIPIAPWHVRGSLLGTDVALASLALRRVATDRLPVPTAVIDSDRQGFAETVAFANPADMTDADRDAIVAAMGRGRARVKAIARDPAMLDAAAAAAGIGGQRLAAARWTLDHDPASFDACFSLVDLLRLGGEGADACSFDAWGPSGSIITGVLASTFPDAQPWDLVAGRAGTPALSAGFADLELRVAEALADRKLPASLARSVLAAAYQDFVDEARLAHLDDMASAVAYVQSISRARLDDYVAALTVNGPLVPADREKREPEKDRQP
jgi:hypothetical protein